MILLPAILIEPTKVIVAEPDLDITNAEMKRLNIRGDA
jgi:hypothetical protein